MALQNGIYRVRFATPLGQGDGVVVLDGERLRGGDSMMWYNGTYKTFEDARFSAVVAVNTHSVSPGMASALGVQSATLELTGSISGNQVSAQGSAAQAPGVKFSATLTPLQLD